MDFEINYLKMIVMEKFDEYEIVKGKEFTIAKILFLVGVIIFIIPVVLVLILKFLFSLTQITKVSANSPSNSELPINEAYSNN